MSGIFSKPKVPKPPPVPTVDEAAESREVFDRQRRRRGAAENLLTSPLGDTSSVQTASKTLLGR